MYINHRGVSPERLLRMKRRRLIIEVVGCPRADEGRPSVVAAPTEPPVAPHGNGHAAPPPNDLFQGLVKVEIGPLDDFSQLVGFEDAAGQIDATAEISVERFAEARMSARAPRFGNIRIRHELAQHGAVLSEEANQALVASELDRARAVHARRFAGAPPDLKQSARQARFLAARGFSADVIRRVLRESDRDDDTPADRGRVRR